MLVGYDNLFANNGIFDASPEDDSVNVWDGNRWVATDATGLNAIPGIASDFQANAGTGTFLDPQIINDGTLGTTKAYGDDVGEYIEIRFNSTVKLTRFRQYGFDNGYNIGTYKLQYWNAAQGLFQDWITDIAATRTTAWSDYTTGKTINTSIIRVVITSKGGTDSFDGVFITELEVIY